MFTVDIYSFLGFGVQDNHDSSDFEDFLEEPPGSNIPAIV
jgi:hypothetical protein